MATPPSLVHAAFGAGIDQGQQDEILDPLSGFHVLENCRQDDRGGLTKRLGFSAQVLTRLSGSRSAGYKLFTHDKQACVIDGTYLDVYADTPAVNVTKSRVPEATTSTFDTTALGDYGGNTVTGMAYVGGYLGVASTVAVSTSQFAFATVYDAASRQVVRGPEQVATLTNGGVMRMVAYSTYLIAIIVASSGAGVVDAYYLDTTSSTTIANGWTVFPYTLFSDFVGGGSKVLAAWGMSNRFAVAYHNNSGGLSPISVRTFTIAAQQEARTLTTGVPSAIDTSGSIAGILWVIWNEAGTINAIALDGDLLATPIGTAGTVATLAATFVAIREVSTTQASVVLSVVGSPNRTYTIGAQVSAGAVVTYGTAENMYGSYAASQPFVQSARTYAGITSLGDEFTVCDCTPNTASETGDWFHRPVASPAMRGTPSLVTATYGPSPSTTGAASKYYVAFRQARSASALIWSVAEIDFAATSRWQAAEHNNVTVLSGGVVSTFDGAEVAEAAFLTRPGTPTAAIAGVGFTTAAGGWRYVATWEYIDAAGNWHVSGISDPSTITGNLVNQSVNVSVAPLSITMRSLPKSSVRVSFYRTVDGGSPPYYFVASVANNPASSALTYSEAISDAALVFMPKLYAPSLTGAVGAALDRRAPPGFACLVSYNGMLVGANGEDLWHSGQTVRGEGTWFSPVFQMPIDEGGPITALAVQDGSLVVFKRSSIFVVSGESPSDNGAAGGLGTPRRLSVDVGCIDPRSVVVTALGVFFQSARGLEILTRAQSVEWIGEQVKDTVASYPKVTAAVLDDAAALVRFTCATTETSNQVSDIGVHLVYDLTTRLWQSVDKVTATAGVEEKPAQSAAMVYTGSRWAYAWLETTGKVWVERATSDASAYLDDSAWVTMKAETGWIKTGGIQGSQMMNRVLVLGRKSTAAGFLLYAGYDYATSYKTARTFSSTETNAVSTAIDRIQLEHTLHDEAEGQAVKFKFQDAAPSASTSTGKGMTWIAFTIEGAQRPGAARLPETSR